ncbi:MAG: hypothetical protein QXO37_07905 [Candidatus Nitrosocaldaceae archaeon]
MESLGLKYEHQTWEDNSIERWFQFRLKQFYNITWNARIKDTEVHAWMHSYCST